MTQIEQKEQEKDIKKKKKKKKTQESADFYAESTPKKKSIPIMDVDLGEIGNLADDFSKSKPNNWRID